MKSKRFTIAASIIILPLIAYGLARLVVYALPISPDITSLIVISLLVLAVLLIVPFLMLKGSFHNAETKGGSDKELRLKDLPKDAAQPVITYPNKD